MSALSALGWFNQLRAWDRKHLLSLRTSKYADDSRKCCCWEEGEVGSPHWSVSPAIFCLMQQTLYYVPNVDQFEIVYKILTTCSYICSRILCNVNAAIWLFLNRFIFFDSIREYGRAIDCVHDTKKRVFGGLQFNLICITRCNNLNSLRVAGKIEFTESQFL